ncbi:MAG: hypothetical protein ACE5LA_01210 [Dehalococcoidales bacterium]
MKHCKIFRIIAIAFILPLLLVVMPGMPVLAAPVITLSPTSGAIGTMVTVTGANFDSYIGDNIFIFFDNEEIAKIVPQTGSFSFDFNIPSGADPGVHKIKAKIERGYVVAENLFTVAETEIKLDTEAGVVGTEVTIDGKGFSVDKMVTFYYHNKTKEKLGTEVASPIGEFSYSFIIPDSTAGKHKVTAENAEGNSAEVEFEVIPSTTLSPTSGAIADILIIGGTGFGYRKVVAIFFKDTLVSYARTNEYGNFEVAFNVPAMMPDTYEVKAEDGDGNIAKAEFALTAGASLNKTKGSVGTELIVTGTGFIPSGAITIKYDDVTIGTIPADSNGAFRASFEVPVSRFGNHTITLSDGVNTKQLVFAVEWEAPPVPALISPSHATEAKAQAYLDWEDVTDPSLPITYSLQVASDKNFTSIVLEKKGLTVSEYTLTKEGKLAAVKEEAPYYWRVKAMDGATNESEWSTPWSFYVAAPSVPMLLLPSNASKAEAQTYFDWEDVTSLSPPITYHLQVASDENFDSIVLEKQGLAESEYTLTKEEKLAAVKKEVPYYWRVKAIDDAANESEWSTPWSFYVGFSFALPGWAAYILIGLGVLLVGFVAFLVGRRTAYYQQ